MARHEHLPVYKAALKFERFASSLHAGRSVSSVARHTALAEACLDAATPGHRLGFVYTSARMRSLGVSALKDTA